MNYWYTIFSYKWVINKYITILITTYSYLIRPLQKNLFRKILRSLINYASYLKYLLIISSKINIELHSMTKLNTCTLINTIFCNIWGFNTRHNPSALLIIKHNNKIIMKVIFFKPNSRTSLCSYLDISSFITKCNFSIHPFVW